MAPRRSPPPHHAGRRRWPRTRRCPPHRFRPRRPSDGCRTGSGRHPRHRRGRLWHPHHRRRTGVRPRRRRPPSASPRTCRRIRARRIGPTT
ncbi:hypothetical protein ESN35_04385 [Bifidobacterium pullorum subsp. gallinarum]|uniref:Uncharacterized protein n=1 Tax=Bifidobacterium pullorum subsp. gallinarum TaxID=78344 RepID=A0A4P6E6E3_9BIFI|nr:hypothetical protein ESN35_04385 [Bifidobacterium pullorum subsp. gallinarum]